MRRCSTYANALCVLALLGLAGGCGGRGTKFVELPAASVKVRIVDAAGRELTDVIMVTAHYETREHMRLEIAHATSEPYHTVRAELAAVTSGFTLRQPEKSRMEYRTPKGVRTRLSSIGYEFLSEGYRRTSVGLRDTEVADYAETGVPVVVTLSKIDPNTPDSGAGTISCAELCLEDVLPHVKEDDPFRERLISMLIMHLEQVRDSGRLGEEAVAALKTLRAMEDPGDAAVTGRE